jgi:neutral ceramidase
MPQNSNFKIGSGIHDITGPAAGRLMLGYLKNKTAGIHLRLRSRAFVIESISSGKRVAMACADLDILPQAVKMKVVEKLKNEFGDEPEGGYNEKNVLLCANHTHSGPAGYSHYALYNFGVKGIFPAFDKKNFDTIVDGIYGSIIKAHENLASGDIYIKTEELNDAGWNRSSQAYQMNPKVEREEYHCSNTNKKMTLLKFAGADGTEVGLWNWFASHCTSLGNKNQLISGDHKGYAAYRLEHEKGQNYEEPGGFVAAFAQAEEGDVSPNIPWGPPDGEHDFEHLEFIGNREYKHAKFLYDNATEKLDDIIDYRHTFVKFSESCIKDEFLGPPYVDPNFTPGCSYSPHTCPPAVGLHLLAGSTEDGPGLFFIKEGMKFFPPKVVEWLLKKFLNKPEVVACQKPKDVILSKRKMNCRFLGEIVFTPEILPIQIIRIGKLVILAVPAEFTTMSGMRLKKTVQQALSDPDQHELVVAGISNAFSGYVATEHEYMVQHYEGASTLFGAYTLNAYLQKFHELISNPSIGPGPDPEDLTNKQPIRTRRRMLFDRAPLFRRLGSVRKDAKESYQKGEKVEVKFWGANPNNDFRIHKWFLKVERKTGDSWTAVAHDWDHETRFKWKNGCFGKSKITIEWYIPKDAANGKYQIRYEGDKRTFPCGRIILIKGKSRIFQVS